MRGRMVAMVVGASLLLVAAACSNSSSTGTASGGIPTTVPTTVAPATSMDPTATACQALQQVQQMIPQLGSATGSTQTQVDEQLIQLNNKLQAAGMQMAGQNPKVGTLLQNAGLAISALQAAVASGVDVTKAQDALMNLVDQANTQLSCAGASPSATP
jgi:hypothetical protein